MPIIAHPIGDIDQNIVISDLYKPSDFHEGWYFLHGNLFTDADEDIIREGDKVLVADYIPESPFPSGTPFPYRYITIYPSGVPVGKLYWELYSDIDYPYVFSPIDNEFLDGEIVYVDVTTPLQHYETELSLFEKLLNGTILKFREKLIEDTSFSFDLKEKIISLLNVDLKLISKDQVKLIWNGDSVEKLEILRKGFGQIQYGEPLVTVPFEPREYLITLDNNSYTYTIRGIYGTGISANEVTLGMNGDVNIEANIDLGDLCLYRS
jgi:hypothetical protein